MATPPKSMVSPSGREAMHDQRTEMVKAQVARENAEMDARTKRLKALRLEKEAEEAANPPPPPAPKPAKVSKTVKAVRKPRA